MTAPVPTFYLYGEPQREVAEGFVHVESLDHRSRPSEWTIQSHIHRDLNHIILFAQGGGSMRADGEQVVFNAPCLLLVPAGVVHGFAWCQDSCGWVTTIADSYLQHLLKRDRDLQPLFGRPRAVSLDAADRTEVEGRIGQLGRELGWSGSGQRAAIEALLL